MFAIPFNFPFRKSNGDMSTIGAEINAGGGGGGGSYTLPTASAEIKGGIKIGAGLSMDGETLNNDNPTPATPYNLPTASADTLGGVKVGTGLSIDENGVLSSNGGGGATIKSIELSISKIVPANSFINADIQSAELYNKTILGVSTTIASLGVCFCKLEDWQNKKLINIMFFNAASSQTTTTKVTVTYVD